LTFVLVVAAAFLITSQIERRYTATALLVVDNRDSQLLGFQAATEGAGESLVDTEVEIARSSAVLRRAAGTLGLAAMPEYSSRTSPLDMLRGMIGLNTEVQSPAPTATTFDALSPSEQARTVQQLSQSLNIARRGLTNIISVSATAASPELAAKIANVVANAYLEEQINAKLTSNDRAAAFLRDRVESLAASIAKSESDIDNFVTSKLDQLGSPETKALLTKLADESRKRAEAGTSLADIQQALAADDYMRLARLAEATQAGLAEQRQQLVAQMAAMTDQPGLADATQKLQTLDAEIKAAAQKRVADLQDKISLSNGLSAAFRSQMASALADVRLPGDVSAELFQLQRDAESNRALYDSSIAKLRQVEQQGDFKIPDSRVIASANPPAEPSYPPRRLILAAAVLFALGLGIGLAFLREHFIGGITSIEQLENLTGMQAAAAVPRFQPSDGRVDMAIVNQPLSPFSEAIRRVQLGIDMLGPKGKRCLLVTSTVPSEGKTTVALALARQMALAGNSVLMIDADLRHPSAHGYLGVEVREGLIDFLTDARGAELDQLAITHEEATGVSYVLGSKASGVATDRLLMSSAFQQLMKYARDTYDVVIVDTPPAGLVVDASIVAQHCDAALYVVRYASTGQNQVRVGARDLLRTRLPALAVLNMLSEVDGRRYGYGHKYRAYYSGAA
jgi:capsular exopolysaccharide synthesis family protein